MPRGKEHPADRPAGDKLRAGGSEHPSHRTPSLAQVLLTVLAFLGLLVVVGFATDWSLAGLTLAGGVFASAVLLLTLVTGRAPPTYLEVREKNKPRRDRW